MSHVQPVPVYFGGSFGYSGLKKSDDFRWKNSDAKKRYDAIKVAPHLEKVKVKSVDTKKVKLHVLKPYICRVLKEMIQSDDEVTLECIMGQLDHKLNQYPDPKDMQISITGYMNEGQAKDFIGVLWPLLMSATENGTGIPQVIIDAKRNKLNVSDIMRKILDPSKFSKITKEKIEPVKRKTVRGNYEIDECMIIDSSSSLKQGSSSKQTVQLECPQEKENDENTPINSDTEKPGTPIPEEEEKNPEENKTEKLEIKNTNNTAVEILSSDDEIIMISDSKKSSKRRRSRSRSRDRSHKKHKKDKKRKKEKKSKKKKKRRSYSSSSSDYSD